LIIDVAAAAATHDVMIADVAGLVAGAPCRWPLASVCQLAIRY
jgi:hypothetical protein